MKTENINYRFKVRSPVTKHLMSIGFNAGSQSFKTKEEALEYRANYPVFFILNRPLPDAKIVLVKETVIQEIVE